MSDSDYSDPNYVATDIDRADHPARHYEGQVAELIAEATAFLDGNPMEIRTGAPRIIRELIAALTASLAVSFPIQQDGQTGEKLTPEQIAAARERLAAIRAERDAARGRPLTPGEKLDNLSRALREIDEAERLSDADKDSIRARIKTDISANRQLQTRADTWNDARRVGAIGRAGRAAKRN